MTRAEMVEAVLRVNMGRRRMKIILDAVDGASSRKIRQQAREAGDAWVGHHSWRLPDDEWLRYILEQHPGRLAAVHRAFARLMDQ